MAGRIVKTLFGYFKYKGTGKAGTLFGYFKYKGTGKAGTLRNKLLIAILIIALLVVYYVFGMEYINQRQEREALAFQIATVTQALAQMSEPPQNLERRLEVAQERLAAEQSMFPTQFNSTEVVSTIMELANSLGVNVIPLVTQSWLTEVVGENNYDVLRLTIAAEGNFSQLVNFLSRLENGEYQTLVVEDLIVDRVATVSEGSGSEGTASYIASFDLAIYARSLTPD